MKPTLCGFCYYGPNAKSEPAEFIINGQAVCEDHVDDTDKEFGPAIERLWREFNKESAE